MDFLYIYVKQWKTNIILLHLTENCKQNCKKCLNFFLHFHWSLANGTDMIKVSPNMRRVETKLGGGKVSSVPSWELKVWKVMNGGRGGWWVCVWKKNGLMIHLLLSWYFSIMSFLRYFINKNMRLLEPKNRRFIFKYEDD